VAAPRVRLPREEVHKMFRLVRKIVLGLVTLSILIVPAGSAYAQDGPIQSTSHYVGPMSTGAGAFLTTCPDQNPIITPGQVCTDTFITVFENRDGANYQPPVMFFLQVTFGGNGFVSGAQGSGPATLSITPPLRAATVTGIVDLTVCDADFNCIPSSATVSAVITASSELVHGKVALFNSRPLDTLSLHTGMAQLRVASAKVIVNGAEVPGVGVDWARSFITRSRSVDVCISAYPDNCF